MKSIITKNGMKLRECLGGLYDERIEEILKDVLASEFAGELTNVSETNEPTYLHIAALYGNTAAVKIILQKAKEEGKDKILINAKDDKGRTPLHYVHRYGMANKELIEELYNNGADINAKDNEGKTPLHYAVACGFDYRNSSEIYEALISLGADLNSTDNEGRTPLFYAVDTKHLDAFYKLMNREEIDVTVKDNDGDNILHYLTKKLGREIFLYWEPDLSMRRIGGIEDVLRVIKCRRGRQMCKKLINEKDKEGNTVADIWMESFKKVNIFQRKLVYIFKHGVLKNLGREMRELLISYGARYSNPELTQRLRRVKQLEDYSTSLGDVSTREKQDDKGGMTI